MVRAGTEVSPPPTRPRRGTNVVVRSASPARQRDDYTECPHEVGPQNGPWSARERKSVRHRRVPAGVQTSWSVAPHRRASETTTRSVPTKLVRRTAHGPRGNGSQSATDASPPGYKRRGP